MSVTLKLYNGDWVQRSDGTLQLVEGAEKCAQDIGESFQNNRDPNGSDWFNGSELYLIDKNPVLFAQQGLAAELLIRKMLEESLFRLINLQAEDAYCDDTERIAYLKTLTVTKVGNSSYGFYVVAITDSDEEVKQNYRISLIPQLPEGFSENLMGGNALNASTGKKTFL